MSPEHTPSPRTANKLTLRDVLPNPNVAKLYDHGFVVETPTVPFRRVGNANLHLKLENWQGHAGSFKIRGAANALLCALEKNPEQLRKHGVVIASAGNAGAGTAIVGRKLGLEVTVVAPPTAPRRKKDLIKTWGAELNLKPRNVDEALAQAEQLAKKRNAFLLPPFDHPDVLDGQGTVGYELYAQLPSVKKAFAGFGGGSLATGLGVALHEFEPTTEIYGVMLAPKDDPNDRFIPIDELPETRSFNPDADGTAVSKRATVIWPETQKHVHGILQVATWRLGCALTELDIHGQTLDTEMAGALGLAGMLLYADIMQQDTQEPQDWAAIVSGGNRDVSIAESYKKDYARLIGAQTFLGRETLKALG